MSYYTDKREVIKFVEEALQKAAKEYTEIDIESLLLEIDRAYGMRLIAQKHINKLLEQGLITIIHKDKKSFGAWYFNVSELQDSDKA